MHVIDVEKFCFCFQPKDISFYLHFALDDWLSAIDVYFPTQYEVIRQIYIWFTGIVNSRIIGVYVDITVFYIILLIIHINNK